VVLALYVLTAVRHPAQPCGVVCSGAHCQCTALLQCHQMWLAQLGPCAKTWAHVPPDCSCQLGVRQRSSSASNTAAQPGTAAGLSLTLVSLLQGCSSAELCLLCFKQRVICLRFSIHGPALDGTRLAAAQPLLILSAGSPFTVRLLSCLLCYMSVLLLVCAAERKLVIDNYAIAGC
jgi:hypothetical protein